MPRSNITSITVTQVWDDSTSTDLVIKRCVDAADKSYYISLEQEGEVVNIYPESWDEIKDQVDALFQEISGSMD